MTAPRSSAAVACAILRGSGCFAFTRICMTNVPRAHRSHPRNGQALGGGFEIGLKARGELDNLRPSSCGSERETFMSDDAPFGPFLVLTAICDASARPAAVTIG